MNNIPVYAQEMKDDLDQVIRSTARVAYASLVEATPAPENPLPKNLVTRLRSFAGAPDDRNFDLFHMKSVLATVGWNKNDDVFDKKEIWLARHTPEDKPFNIEHNQELIVGHITGSYAVDDEQKTIAEDSAIDALPQKFHVVNREVLYRCWENEDRQKEMDRIIVEISQGKWFVSMEALFQDFDYALVDNRGNARVVARNEETAFLTKHLRAYSGSGKYQDYKVGRVLKNFVFSGKGLVRKPANPESVIFGGESERTTSYIFSPKNSQTFQPSGYSPVKENEMDLEKQVAELKAKNEDLQRQLHEVDKSGLKARAEELEKTLAVKEEELKNLKLGADKHEEMIEDMKKKHAEQGKQLEDAHTKLKEHKDELDKIKAEQVRAGRLAAVKAAFGMDDAKALEYVQKSEQLPEEVFQATLAATSDYMSKKMAEYKEAQTASPMVTQTSAPPTTPTAPTVHKEIPRATSAPAPAAAAPVAVKKIGEDGNAVPQNTVVNTIPEFPNTNPHQANAALEQATPQPSAALAVPLAVENEKVEKIQKGIAGLMAQYLNVKLQGDN